MSTQQKTFASFKADLMHGTGNSVGGRIMRILFAARLLPPVILMAVGLTSGLLISLALLQQVGNEEHLSRALLISVLVAVVGLVLAGHRLLRQLLAPLASLEESVAQVCQGEPGAMLSKEDTGVLGPMVRDIDSLNEELTDLYEDMDTRVARHTTRLAQKTASLKILYDVAASINQAQDLDELLIRYMRVLKEMVNGLAATVRVLMPDGKMRLVGSIGLNNDVMREHEMLPMQLCLCGIALSPGDILCVNHARHCSRKLGRKMFDSDEVEVVAVPLEYHDEVLGLYNIFIKKPGVSEREDIMELLKTIGSHLGMAVAKQQSDAEARRLSIVGERTALAHELHDSLAQTLASLRFQLRMLEDTLKQNDALDAAGDDLQRIRNGMDEAHTELRALLSSFRAPVDQRGMIPALEKLVQRFQQETGIHTYFQQECRQANLSASDEMQMLRIVQESLANIRKHAQAHTVRLLFKCRADGTYLLLIEDDGVGFEHKGKQGQPGEHIGLSIMEERAHRLGGELRIESEPGEGTRVELSYKPASESPDNAKSRVL